MSELPAIPELSELPERPELPERAALPSPTISSPEPSGDRPTSAEMAAAVAASEEMNTADEVYAAEMAGYAESEEADQGEPATVRRPGDDALESTDARIEPAEQVEPAEPSEHAEPSELDRPEERAEVARREESAEPVGMARPEASAEPQDSGTTPDLAGSSLEQLGEQSATEQDDSSAVSENPETPKAPETSRTSGVSAASDESEDGPATPTMPANGRSGGRPGPAGRRPTPLPPRGPATGRPAALGRSAAVDGQPTDQVVVHTDRLVEASDPTPWGRIDSDGTVYVITGDAERAVGYWQAGDEVSGLAHYGRRFDDFVTEIVVLETRLASGTGDAKAIRSHAALLRQSIDTLPAVGDLASAAARLDTVLAAADDAVSAAAQDRANVRAAAMAQREALCAEAEQLAESTQWKTSGDRLKEIVEEWRTIRGLDRRTDDQLWRRFSKARDTFIRRRGSHFAEMDKERSKTKEVKEALISRAEELSDSTDWAATAAAYRTLMADWKAAGRTGRDVEDALWERFRAAQERFFSRRQETFASRDAEFESNAAKKEQLLSAAERIDPASNLDAAKAALRSLQSRWEDAGKVPRERIRSLDGRLKAVEDRIRTAEDKHWRRTDPESSARLAQFRARYETYKTQAEKATAAGDAKRAAAAQAQADQWLEWLKAAELAVE